MMALGKIWLRVSGMAVLVSGLACANADEQPIDAIIVTASRLEQPAENLSQTIDVIERGEIQRLWASSALEVLRQIPGANVIQQGGRGGVSSILLRGGEPNFTVVLIDGIQVNDPTNSRGGSFDIGTLEQSQIGRVETIFGAMSPVYGSDALAGVINFLTRGADSGSDITIEAGSGGYDAASGFYAGSIAGIDVGLGAYGADDGGAVAGADYESRGLNGRFSGGFGDTGTAVLSLGLQHTTSTSFPEDSGGPELATIRALDSRDVREVRAGLQAGYLFSGRWKTDFHASIYSRDEDYTSPGIAPGVFGGVPPNAADTRFDRTRVYAAASTDFPGNVTGLLGAEWQNEHGTSAGFIDIGFPLPTDFRLDRDTVAVFSEASMELGDLVLHGGIRWDGGGIDNVVTGRVGLLYRFQDGLSELKVNWGEGFKAPSFFALGHPLVGNRDLRPESGDSVDLGILHRFSGGTGSFEFVVFRNSYQDLVDFDPDLFVNVNRDSVVTRGAGASVEYSPSDRLTVDLHLTYLDTDVKGSDTVLRGRPKWRGSAEVAWKPAPDWRWVMRLLAMDRFHESSIPTGGVWLDGYVRVDTALTWDASSDLSIGLAVDNLVDRQYHEAVGFPAAGLRGRIGATYHF